MSIYLTSSDPDAGWSVECPTDVAKASEYLTAFFDLDDPDPDLSEPAHVLCRKDVTAEEVETAVSRLRMLLGLKEKIDHVNTGLSLDDWEHVPDIVAEIKRVYVKWQSIAKGSDIYHWLQHDSELYTFVTGNITNRRCIVGHLCLPESEREISFHELHSVTFCDSCGRGHFEIAQWLYRLDTVNHATLNRAFILTCSLGYLDIAKWLHSQGADTYDKALIYACCHGHESIAKWLYDLGANIHTENNAPFRLSCASGNLNIAKWLYGQSDEIHNEVADEYMRACFRGQSEIAKWLYELDANIHD